MLSASSDHQAATSFIIKEVPLSSSSLAATSPHSLADHDYVDVFQMCLSRPVELRARDALVLFFESLPASFYFMLLVREKLAGWLGLKTAPEISRSERKRILQKFQGRVGESLALFEVLDASPQELLTGANDSHLDFRMSMVSRQVPESGETRNGIRDARHDLKTIVELITLVKMHNIVGRIYFMIVRPIHKFFMKRIMHNMARKLAAV